MGFSCDYLREVLLSHCFPRLTSASDAFYLQLTDKRLAIVRFVLHRKPALMSMDSYNLITGHVSELGEDWCV